MNEVAVYAPTVDFQLEYASESGLRVTTICPACGAQVFGYLCEQTIDDMALHMNLFHPRGRRC